MRFALSPDQEAFREAIADLLARACPPTTVRAAWEAPPGRLDRSVWEDLAGMGVLSVLVPEADGGLGLDETYLVPVIEACGRAALPHPVVETAMVAAPLMGADGGLVTTDLGGPNIPTAADADALLLRRGDALVRVAPAEVALEPVQTVDGARRAARLAPDADLRAAELVSDDPAVVERAIDRGALGTAAMLVGLAQAMLDQTVAYVTQRHQFGVPVGSFQAVKHHLADVALALEHTRPVVWRAAWSLAHDVPTRTRDVSAAKAMANETAARAARAALQCHGAIGYTVEADLHLFLKRTWALTRAWGDTAHHTDRVADALMPGSRSHA